MLSGFCFGLSADGKLKHKVDINLERSILPHEMGIIKKFLNVFIYVAL